jgi:hypothetical protein
MSRTLRSHILTVAAMFAVWAVALAGISHLPLDHPAEAAAPGLEGPVLEPIGTQSLVQSRDGRYTYIERNSSIATEPLGIEN